jgi:3-phenylpropionate/trans-cinnamate dioxygenase ferredoxin reductase subunit
MLGSDAPYTRVPYFFSDQYDAGLEYVGRHGAGDRLVIRGTLEDAAFQALWTGPDGRVTAGMHVNDWEAIDEIRRLVDEGVALDESVR